MDEPVTIDAKHLQEVRSRNRGVPGKPSRPAPAALLGNDRPAREAGALARQHSDAGR